MVILVFYIATTARQSRKGSWTQLSAVINKSGFGLGWIHVKIMSLRNVSIKTDYICKNTTKQTLRKLRKYGKCCEKSLSKLCCEDFIISSFFMDHAIYICD